MESLSSAPVQSLSISHGAPIEANPDRLVSLAGALLRAAERSPNKGIRYLNADGTDTRQTYPQLVENSARWLGGLRAAGMKAGDKLIFQLDRNEEFVTAFWACMMGGIVPVPISIPPGYDEPHGILAKLQNAWAMLGNPPVLVSDAMVTPVERFGQRQSLSGFRVLPTGALQSSAADRQFHANAPEDLAVLLLTSGSTGMPKGVQLNHRNILSRSAATSQMNAFGESDVSLNWMPLDHVGGLVMFHIRDVYCACDQIQAATGLVLSNPSIWLDWISKYKVTVTWAPNFAFGLVNEQTDVIASGSWDLSSLRFILNGGEAIVSKTARKFLSLLIPHGLPAESMHPAWGMSETSSGVTYSNQFSLDQTSDADPFVEVGGPVPGISIRIVDKNDQPVPEGKVGGLQVRGASVTVGYYKNPELNREVFSADGWFITGDLGVIKEGRLTITGREKDVIIINGVNFHSHEIESIVEDVDGVEVSFAAACAVRLNEENTDRIAIFFSPTTAGAARVHETIKAIRAAVVKKEAINPDFVIPLPQVDIPKTAIGKIQRTQLKQRFERGDFAELVAKFSNLGEDKTAPSWFYRPTWRATPLSTANLKAGLVAWILGDKAGIGGGVRDHFASAGVHCVLIEAGDRFAALSATHFQVSPDALKDYVELSEKTPLPDLIVHGWTHGAREGEPKSTQELEAQQTKGALSVLGLVQALARKNREEKEMKMLVVSSQTRPVDSRDQIAYERTPIIGLVRTIPQEIAWLDCHHVDLDEADYPVAASWIADEFASWDYHTESAWRQKARFTPGLERAGVADSPSGITFKTGGFYLLSGGIGGIGTRFAAHLLQHYGAKLLIVGRTPLPPQADWPRLVNAGGRTAEHIRTWQGLSVLGGEADYASADVADLGAMRQILEKAETRWGGKVDGVLHLAGIYHEALLEKETVSGLTSVMRPKVCGAWVLHQLVKDRPGTLFINFSSLISHFGSLSTGAYAAANNFLDAFSHYQRVASGLRTYNLLWSSWTDIGMSRGYDAAEALRSRGYLPITADQGISSLQYALKNDHPQLLIGLDGNNKSIQRYLKTTDIPTAPEPSAAHGNSVPPRNQVEAQMAKIWQEILNVPSIGIRDNFFELGGRSLLAAKMFAQINKRLGKNLPIPALFKAPTIEHLAVVFLEQPKSPLVKIDVLQSAGSEEPVFWVAEAGTEPAAYAELSAQFGSSRSFFVLRAQALLGSVPRSVSLPELALAFTEEIEILVPSGRFILGGSGFGCVLAWSTGEHLVSRGRGKDLATMVMSTPPPAAFFTSEGERCRFGKAPESTGIFGRLFKKQPADEVKITKELRQLRGLYQDTELKSGSWPTVVIGSGQTEPWSKLSRGGCKTVGGDGVKQLVQTF